MSSMILVLNCGSSSIKFALVDPETQINFLSGNIERIGLPNTELSYLVDTKKTQLFLEKTDYAEALAQILLLINQVKPTEAKLSAIGHRVVHGGLHFTHSVLITPEVLADIKACIPLAPLHNPANLLGIETAQKIFPGLPEIAVFDTAFHQNMPDYAYLYALPLAYYTKYQVRRFGFHGISYRYLTQKVAERLNKPLNDSAFILAHLGNGCSICAVHDGKSCDTSMGFTPLEGLVMGTRSGDIDPGLISYLTQQLGCSIEELMAILNKQSGLLGVSEVSADMREILAAALQENLQAKLAIELFCYRLAKYIAAMMVPLGGRIDALVFSGGIGENASFIREKTLMLVSFLGFSVDSEANKTNGKNTHGWISAENSLNVLVIPTNEELVIAQDCFAILKATAGNQP